MTRVLLTAATAFEIAPLVSALKKAKNIDVLITGVGMVATAFTLGKIVHKNSFDLAIQAGIAGSFNRSFALGDVFRIDEDRFAELGAEDGELFLPIEKLGFGEGCETALKPISSSYFADINLPSASAITVNTVHGNEKSIAGIQQRFRPDLESMEGAAFFYACNAVGLPSVQIRAVSNYVERRNRENWNIGLAVERLNGEVGKLLAFSR